MMQGKLTFRPVWLRDKLLNSGMPESLQDIIVEKVLGHSPGEEKSRYRRAKNIYRFRIISFRAFKDTAFLLAGILCAGFGLEGFLLPNKFIDGGATGISLLTSEVTKWPLAILLILVNIPFVILGYRQIGKW